MHPVEIFIIIAFALIIVIYTTVKVFKLIRHKKGLDKEKDDNDESEN